MADEANLGGVGFEVFVIDNVTAELDTIVATTKAGWDSMTDFIKKKATEQYDYIKQAMDQERFALIQSTKDLMENDKTRTAISMAMAKDRVQAAKEAADAEISAAVTAAKEMVTAETEAASIRRAMRADELASAVAAAKAMVTADSEAAAIRRAMYSDEQAAAIAAARSMVESEAQKSTLLKAMLADEKAARIEAARASMAAEEQAAAIRRAMLADEKAVRVEAARAMQVEEGQKAAILRAMAADERAAAIAAAQAMETQEAEARHLRASMVAASNEIKSSWHSMYTSMQSEARSASLGKMGPATIEYEQSMARITELSKTGLVAQNEVAAATQMAGEKYNRAKAAVAGFGDEQDKVTKGGLGTAAMLERMAIRVAALTAVYTALSVVKDAVSEALDVTRQLATISAVTNAGAQGVNDLRESFVRLAGEVGKGPKELGEAYYLIASNSKDASRNIDILNVSAKLSATGLGETADIAKLLTGAMNAYAKSGLTAAQAGDLLFEGVKQGGAEAKEMAGVLGRVTALASEMGVSFKDSLTYVATFTRLGVGADEAVTALRGTLNSLLKDKPGSRADEQLKLLGSSLAAVRQEIKEKGLTQAMLDLIRLTKGDEEAISAIIPNVRALAGVLGTYAVQGNTVVEVNQAMANSTGALETGFGIVAKTASQAADQITAKWEVFKLQLGEALLPALIDIGKKFSEIFDETTARNMAGAIKDLLTVASPLLSLLADLAHHVELIEGLVAGFATMKLWEMWLGPAITYLINLTKAAPAAAEAVNWMGTAIETTTPKVATLGIGIAGLAGPIAIAAAAYVALSTVLREETAAMQHDIEGMVAEMNVFGNKMEQLRSHGFVDADKTKAEFNAVTDELVTLQSKLSKLQSQDASQNFGPADRRTVLLKKEIEDTNNLIARKELLRKQDAALLELAAKQQAVTGGMMPGATGAVAGGGVPHPPGPGADAEAAYQQKIKEANDSLEAQVKLSNANVNQIQQMIDGYKTMSAAQLNGGRQAVLEAEAQKIITAEVNKRTDKNHTVLSADMKAQIEFDAFTLAFNKQEEADKTRLYHLMEQAEATKVKLQEQAAALRRKEIADEVELTNKMKEVAVDQQVAILRSQQALLAYSVGGQRMVDWLGKYNEALDKGLRPAAMLVQEFGSMAQANAEGVQSAEQWADATADNVQRQAKLNALLAIAADAYKPMWQTYLEEGTKAIDSVSTAISTGIADALKTGELDTKKIWESIKNTIIDIFADLMKALIKQWLELLLLKVTANGKADAIIVAQDQAAQLAGGQYSKGVGKSGVGTGSISPSSFTGNGGTSMGSLWGSGGTAGVAGSGSGVSGLFSGTGAGGAAGMVAAWVAVMVVFAIGVNKLNAHLQKTKEVLVTFDRTLNVMGGFGDKQSQSAGMIAASLKFAQRIKDFFTQMGGVFNSLDADFGIKRRGQGKNTDWKVYVDGIVKDFGKDYQAAWDYLMTEVVKHSQVGGIPPEVKDAIKNSAATTMDELQADIDAAYEAVFVRLGASGTQVYQIVMKYSAQINKEIDAAIKALENSLPSAATHNGGGASISPIGGGGLSPVGGGIGAKAADLTSEEATAATKSYEAIRNLIEARNQEITALRNSLIGVDDSGAQRLASIMSFNRGIAESREMVQAEIDKLQQALAGLAGQSGPEVDALRTALNDYIDQLNRLPDAISGTQLDMAVFDELYKYLKDNPKYAKQAAEYEKMKEEIALQALKAQIIALGLWDKYSAMWQDAWNTIEGQTGKGGGKGKGGGGKMQGVQQFIDDQTRMLKDASKSQVGQQIADTKRQYDEQIKAAGKHHDKVKELQALETQALDKIIHDAVAKYMSPAPGDMNGSPSEFEKSVADLEHTFADLREANNALIKAGDKAALTQKQLADAEANAMAQVAQAMIDSWGLPIEQAIKQVNDYKSHMHSLNDMMSHGSIDTATYTRVQHELNEEFILSMGNLAESILTTMAAGNENSDAAKKAATLKLQMDKISFELQIAQFDVLYQALMLMDGVSKGVKDNMTDLFNFINNTANWPNFTGAGNAPGLDPNYTGATGTTVMGGDGHMYQWDGHKWVDLGAPGGSGSGGDDDPYKTARDLLKKYQDEAMNPWARALRDLNADFQVIFTTLGRGPETIDAYNAALQRLKDQYLSGLKDFYTQLSTGEVGGATVSTQYGAARTKYASLLAAVQGGDLSQADALKEAAQSLISLAGKMFGTTTGGFLDVKQQVLDQIGAILGINPASAGSNVIGGPSWFTQGTQQQVAATANVASVVDINSAKEQALLSQINDTLVDISSRPRTFANGITVF